MSDEPRTTGEAFQRVSDALRALFLAACEAAGIERLATWLAKRLEGK